MVAIFAASTKKIRPIIALTGRKVVKQIRGLSKVAKDVDDTDVADTDVVMEAINLGPLDALKGISPELKGAFNNAGQQVTDGLALGPRNLVNPDAVAYAKDRAAELVTDIDESTRDMLRTIIGDALEQNKNYNDIADLISDSNIFSEKRADLIADTEVRMAHGEGILAGQRRARDLGVNVKKEWQEDEDPCPECQENADAGPIDIDDEFPSGDDTVPAHPNCECACLTVVVHDDGEEDEEDDDSE